MKLLERTHLRHTQPHVAETEDHEVLERLEVPDDLSGLVELPEHELRRSAPMVRWLRWAPVALLAVVGVVAAALLMTNDSNTAVETPNWETEGPGSQSLYAPWLLQTEVPWQSDEGPGGTSLNMEMVVPAAVYPYVVEPATGIDPSMETHGPGGNLPDMTWTPEIEPIVTPDWATEGPGSNSQ